MVLTTFSCCIGVTGSLMELPTPAADSLNVPAPQAMETTPPTQATQGSNKGESPSAAPTTVPATKDKQQVGGASSSSINGTYVYWICSLFYSGLLI